MKSVKPLTLALIIMVVFTGQALALGFTSPKITAITPTTQPAGSIVETITGSNLNSVRFVGIYNSNHRLIKYATITSRSATQLVVSTTLTAGTYYFRATGSWFTSSGYSPALVVGAVAPPPSSPGIIGGTVTDSVTQAGLEGATVTISGILSTVTGVGGVYSAAGINPGNYTVTCSLAGYTSQSNQVTLASGGSVSDNFSLVPISVTPPPPNNTGLLWSPPNQVNPLIVHVTDSGQGNPINLSYPLTQDVVIYMPTDHEITGTVNIGGGRNVRVIGGKWNLKYGDACMYIESPAQSIFVEGCHLNSGTNYQGGPSFPASDAPDIIGFRNSAVPSYSIYFQNILIDYAYYKGGNHVDCTQMQFIHPSAGNVYYENCSFTTGDQGIFLQAFNNSTDYSKGDGPVASTVNLHNVDLQYGGPQYATGALLWIADTKEALPTNGGTLDNVWVTALPSQPTWAWYGISVWPKHETWTNDGGATYPFKGWGNDPSADGSYTVFNPADKIVGKINFGRPPGGSFVKPENVGLNYKSPWPITQ